MSTPIEAIYPLTPMQQGILFHVTSEPDSPLYFHQLLLTIDDADAATVRSAWAEVFDRHPALRSLIAWSNRDRPLRLVRPSVDPAWHVEDLSDVADPQLRIDEYLEADRERPFDLESAPLVRFALFDLGSGSHRLVWTFHHIILDGWSTRLILGEISERLRAHAEDRVPDVPRPPAYERYLEWLDDSPDSDGEAFWRRHLGDLSDVTPMSRGATPWATRHIRREAEVDGQRLQEGATRLGVTISTVLQAAWALVLRRRFDARNPVIGVTHSGRPHEIEDIENLVGMLINTMPRRIEVDASETTGGLLERIQRSGIEWARHHTSSLVDIRRWVGWDRPDGLFDSVVVVENVPDEDDSAFRDVEYLEQSNLPFALIAVPGSRLTLIGIADADRFDPDLVALMLEEVAHVASQLVTQPDLAVGDVSVLTARERDRLGLLEATALPPLPHATAGAMVSHGLVRRPERVAVVAHDRSVDYATLRSDAHRLFEELSAAGAAATAPVAIEAHRSVETIAAVVACVTGGLPYIPLDPSAPPARRNQITKAAGVHVDGEGTVGKLGEVSPAGAAPPREDTLAYIMYTSGSSGVPKGVEITQRALAISTLVRRSVYGGNVTAFLVASPLYFDSSVAGLYWTLADGGTIVLPPDDQLDPFELRRLIDQHAVTHMLTLPSLYRILLDSGTMPSLSTVIVAGEPCPPALVAQHFATQPATALYNEYGPTEATVWATVHRVEPGDAAQTSVPIGRPVPGTTVVIGDVDGGRSPLGSVGEILIAGPQLAASYHGDPERTDAAFVQPGWIDERVYRTGDLGRWNAAGALEFRGRRDHQIKLRGHRIELEEIDTRLRQHPSIDDAVTVLREDRIVSFVVGSLPADLDAHLRAGLPAVMIPAVITPLPELPIGATGKVDRDRLPDVDVATASSAGRSLTDTEQIIADAWSEVLGTPVSDPEADFFALGGDSLAVMKIVSRTRQRGIEITARQFFETATLAELAAVAQVR